MLGWLYLHHQSVHRVTPEECPRDGCWEWFLLTHDGQCGGFVQFALNAVQDFQFGTVHLTAIDGAVPRADPVQLLLFKVNRQPWKDHTHTHTIEANREP